MSGYSLTTSIASKVTIIAENSNQEVNQLRLLTLPRFDNRDNIHHPSLFPSYCNTTFIALKI
jgi:hypothetical protein